jgi:type II secretory pathway pseudopilin PulG
MISKCKMLRKKQTGSVLIFIIVSMVIVAVMGTAMFSLLSSSTYSELFMNNRTKAYYLAQAGRNYATMRIIDATLEGKDDNNDGVPDDIPALDGQTFNLSDNSKFYLRIDTSNYDERTYVESTGIVNEGTALETKQKIAFTIESIKFSQDVFAVNQISLNSGAIIDSYDSQIAPYSFASHTQEAIVQTNKTVAPGITLNKSSYIYGDAVCGLGGNPNVLIITNSGSIITGERKAATKYWDPTAPANKVVIPAYTPGDVIPDITTDATLGVDGETHIYKTGRIYLFVKATKTPMILTIRGDVTLITDNMTLSNSKIVIAPGGNLKLYVVYAFSILSLSEINPPCRGQTSPCASPSPATAVRILGIETTTISINNSDIWGGIYGPASTFSHYSGGELYGSVVALSIDVNDGGIHIDKGFSATGGGTGAGNVVY